MFTKSLNNELDKIFTKDYADFTEKSYEIGVIFTDIYKKFNSDDVPELARGL